MADRAVGGFSTANLDYEVAEPFSKTPAHARFHGNISTKLPDNWRVERTGKLPTRMTTPHCRIAYNTN
jgi:NADH dehydrogenase [ubiquinone] 1 alpha subcomplex assembly factor 1